MNKAELRILERCFAAEIDSALEKLDMPFAQMRPSKVLARLIEEGLVQPVEVTRRFNDGLPAMTFKGYALTAAGNLAYCMSCDDEVEP